MPSASYGTGRGLERMVTLASPGIHHYAFCGSIPAHFRIRRRDARVPEIRCRESIRWIQLSGAGRTRWAAAGGTGALTKTPWPRNQDDAAGGLLESTPDRRVLHHLATARMRPARRALNRIPVHRGPCGAQLNRSEHLGAIRPAPLSCRALAPSPFAPDVSRTACCPLAPNAAS